MPDKIPVIVWRSLTYLILLSFILLAYIGLLRSTPQTHTRLNIVPDMDKQQKFTPQANDPTFADGRAMRIYPAGAVARGEAWTNEHLQQGIVDGQWAVSFPMPVTPEVMQRGRRQYDIYCAPCHGFSGYGDGMVAKRAEELAAKGVTGMTWVPPKSLQDLDTRMRPVGHVFNTITNGIRTMPAYGGQISVEDRWAIILYVRALQRSQNSNIADVPASDQQLLLDLQETVKAEQATAQGSGTVGSTGTDTPVDPALERATSAAPSTTDGEAQGDAVESEAAGKEEAAN